MKETNLWFEGNQMWLHFRQNITMYLMRCWCWCIGKWYGPRLRLVSWWRHGNTSITCKPDMKLKTIWQKRMASKTNGFILKGISRTQRNVFVCLWHRHRVNIYKRVICDRAEWVKKGIPQQIIHIHVHSELALFCRNFILFPFFHPQIFVYQIVSEYKITNTSS